MPADSPSAVVVFDGDCAFCKIWIDYWRTLTGDGVEYLPYQSAEGRFAEIPRADFQRAVHFFKGDARYRGAEAVFQLAASVPGQQWKLFPYYKIPGFSGLAEWCYRLIAAHRNAAYKITRLLWGKRVEKPAYTIASSYFLRALALIYLIAFVSFGRQVRGLIGEQGIQPVSEFFAQVSGRFGSSGFWLSPSIFWFTHNEFALEMIVWGGALIAAVAAIGRPHTVGQRMAFVVLYLYYLSIVNAGQIFMSYQWDFLLLEAGFLAIFLKPALTRIWLFQWLLFRLMFESGAVKLLSHDPSWRNLTALAFHYETQPLPTPLAWYAMQAPLWLHKASTASVFVIELALPFLMFGPRRLKQVAAIGTIGLQTLILLTGNYTFFNLLAIALCLFLFDDAFFARKKAKPAARRSFRFGPVKVAKANRYATVALFALIMTASLTQLGGMFGIEAPSPLRYALSRTAGPFGLINQYGLFAVMTTTRPEISIEGSNDGTDWQPYIFKYKAGPLNRPPPWVAPSQPRLDWQMWFAALGNYRNNPWLLQFMTRLLQGSVPVLDLLEQNPFAGHPPKYVRAMLYQYHFTNFDERRQTGNWWKRELKGEYFPPIGLRVPQGDNH